MSQKFDSVLVFTDGACSGNPGPGGWGAIVALPNGEVTELGDGHHATTNNRMELAGTIAAIRFINKQKKFANTPIDLYTDSTYVIRGITQWIWGWKKKGWLNAEGQEVLNRDMWEELSKVVSARGEGGKINWLYSRGHVGTPGNERCDEIAVAFSKKKSIELYEGPLLSYRVAVYDIPEDSSLPEMRPKTEKKVAHSYLSLLGGEVYRHRDWGSCERRVKGKSGAKFKKAMAASDESKILAEWGLSEKTAIKE
jgi:ribonuclease HI